MPKYADRFSGHLANGDPRTPLHGAGGCVWPTFPAQRYSILSSDASGVFQVFNFTPGLVIRLRTQPDHDIYEYVPFAVPPPWQITLCRKVYNPTTEGYRWELDMNAGSGICSVQWRVEFPFQKCNVDVTLGNKECAGGVPPGASGATFRMEQVEWDEVTPP